MPCTMRVAMFMSAAACLRGCPARTFCEMLLIHQTLVPVLYGDDPARLTVEHVVPVSVLRSYGSVGLARDPSNLHLAPAGPPEVPKAPF